MTNIQTIEPEKVFSLLGVRAGISDDRYFVGRQQLLSSLSMCYFGDGKRTSVWIYGPRRIGKTSVANITAMKAKQNDTLVVNVDAIDISENYFENLLNRAINYFKAQNVLEGKSVKEKFEALAKSSKDNPVLVIFDEMDKVAINLKTSEQAFLRRLDSENDRFCYCFISCQAPELIVEEVPEVSSRLLGICEPHKIGPLEARDVNMLCKIVGSDLKIENYQQIHNIVWSKVGGFPIAVNSLIKALAIYYFHVETICQDDVLERFESKFYELKTDFIGWWNSLKSITQMVLLDKVPFEGNEQYLREDGLFSRRNGVIKPEFLIKAGTNYERSLPTSIPSNIDNSIYVTVGELMRLIMEINTQLLLLESNNAFHLGNETLTHWRLCRSTCSEIEFTDLLSYLYKVFFEGARETKPDKNGIKKYRLPEPFATKYKKAKVIGKISDLRNFSFHDFSSNSDSDKPNVNYIDAGKIFKSYTGKEIPYNDDLRMTIRNGLIEDLVSLLKTISSELRDWK